jgi:serine/threonine-protein kinase
MDLTELQRRVDRYVKLDLRPFHDAYRAQGGSDIDGFLAFLGAQKAIDPSLLKELYAMTDVETPSIHDPAYRGTVLATWVARATQGGSRGGGDARASVPATDSRFESLSRLGEGAMGAIDIARDVYLRRKVALKTVRPEMAGHPEALGRFLSEMQITAQLEHPNIVPVYALDVGADGSIGYAMKLVQGRDFQELLDETREKVERGEPLDEEHSLEKRLEYFLKVCDALEYAHSKGIVHRDLKPANIMIGRHNEVYLMDWGIARPIGAGRQALEAGFEMPAPADPAGKDFGRTRVGSALGTPPYMSPEQAQGKNPELDGKSDQYTMGLILQECVTLKTAVDGRSIEEVLTKAMMAKRDPVPVGNRPGSLPPEIDAIVRKATRQNPKDRYPSIKELADDVRRYTRGEAVSVLPESGLRRAGRWLARHRMATLTIVLGLGLVGAAGTIGALIVGQARIDAEHARELRVSQMAAESAIQTQLVDRELTRYEAALMELVGATQIVLSKTPPSDAAPFFEESFGAKETAPPDFGPSKRYGRDVSVLAPATSLVPGVAREPLDPMLRSLALLGPAFRAVMLESSGMEWRALSAAQQRAMITEVGVPAYRASITLREGAALSFPGMAGRAAGDPREAASYKLAEGKRGVVWGTPTPVDGDSVMAASAALHDEKGAFRGVAALEVSLSRLLARPQAAELDYVQSRSLVGRDGKTIAEDKKGESVPLAPEVAAAIAAGKSGTMVAKVNGRRYQYAYHPLSSLDWYYVAAAEVGQVVDSKKELITSDPRKAIDTPATTPAPKATGTATPAPKPIPAASADPGDAGAAADAGDALDAGAPDASAAKVKLGPLPKPTGEPGEAPLPPNPFDKWKVYERKKKP